MKLFIVAVLFAAVAVSVDAGALNRRVARQSDNDERIWWNGGGGGRRTTTTTTTTASPATGLNPNCMSRCLRTPEYNPHCAQIVSSGLRRTYSNPGEMTCANACGETNQLLFRGTCAPL